MTDLTLISVTKGRRWPLAHLKKTLKSPVWVVRFAKAFGLDAYEFGALLRLLFPDVDIVKALTLEGGDHSASLQTYLVDLGYDSQMFPGLVPEQTVEPDPEVDLLAEMFEELEVKLADGLDDIVYEVADLMTDMPGKEGRMGLKSLLKVDRKIQKRLGVHEAQIIHAHTPPNLVVLDVSASMSEETIKRIVDAVVSLANRADAHLIIVSDTARTWKPGEFDTGSVLAESEFSGTHYEKLAPAFDRNWGTVITIADYDSGWDAKDLIAQCKGRISLLLDISLVNRPTYLAECLGQLADEVRPLMVAKASLTYAF